MSSRYTNDELRQMAEMDNAEGKMAVELLESRGVQMGEI